MDPNIIKTLQIVLSVLGNVSLEDAVTWLQVEENAERLLAEIARAEAESAA